MMEAAQIAAAASGAPPGMGGTGPGGQEGRPNVFEQLPHREGLKNSTS